MCICSQPRPGYVSDINRVSVVDSATPTAMPNQCPHGNEATLASTTSDERSLGDTTPRTPPRGHRPTTSSRRSTRSFPRTRAPPPPQARYATVSDSRTIHDSLTKRTPLTRHSAKRTCPYIVLLGEVRAYSCGCVHVRSDGAGGCALVVTVHS